MGVLYCTCGAANVVCCAVLSGNEENVDMVAERIRQRLEYRGGELHPLAGVQSMDALRPYIPKVPNFTLD